MFLDSLKRQHGEEIEVIFSTRDLNESQISELKRRYARLEVRNESLDLELLSARTGLSQQEILAAKRKTEHGKFDLTWKQFISVEDRYRNSIMDVVQSKLQHERRHLIHMDIDMYFKRPINELFKLVQRHDISIYFRPAVYPKYQFENRRVLGNMIGFALDPATVRFLECWIRYIDAIPLTEKPVGYGQLSFYLAHLEMRDAFDWGQIPLQFVDPDRPATAHIWTGNVGEKDKSLKEFRVDFVAGNRE